MTIIHYADEDTLNLDTLAICGVVWWDEVTNSREQCTCPDCLILLDMLAVLAQAESEAE